MPTNAGNQLENKISKRWKQRYRHRSTENGHARLSDMEWKCSHKIFAIPIPCDCWINERKGTCILFPIEPGRDSEMPDQVPYNNFVGSFVPQLSIRLLHPQRQRPCLVQVFRHRLTMSNIMLLYETSLYINQRVGTIYQFKICTWIPVMVFRALMLHAFHPSHFLRPWWALVLISIKNYQRGWLFFRSVAPATANVRGFRLLRSMMDCGLLCYQKLIKTTASRS